jgi:hypothetical protein
MEEWVPPSPLFLGLRSRVLLPTGLPFYKKYPKLTGAALGITGSVLLAPVAIVGVLGAVGFTSAGVAAGNSTPLSPKEIPY